MRTIRTSIVLTLIVGLLAAVPVLAQTSEAPSAAVATDGPGYLQLLVTINKLDLSQTQMQQIHDILAGILTKADAIKSDRDAFAKEMLAFAGSSDELDAALSAFQKKMVAAQTALSDAVTQAVKDISGILTIEQGQVLKQAFPGFSGVQALGAQWLGRMAGPAAAQNQSGQNNASSNPQTPAQRIQNQRNTSQNDPPEPWCPMGLGYQGQSASGLPGRAGVMPRMSVRAQAGSDLGFGIGARNALGDGFAARRLSVLQEVVDILGAKLQAGS